jgi:hypothetical protein
MRPAIHLFQDSSHSFIIVVKFMNILHSVNHPSFSGIFYMMIRHRLNSKGRKKTLNKGYSRHWRINSIVISNMKRFFKYIYILWFLILIFLIFVDYFNVLILKITYYKNIIFINFKIKNTLKNGYAETLVISCCLRLVANILITGLCLPFLSCQPLTQV